MAEKRNLTTLDSSSFNVFSLLNHKLRKVILKYGYVKPTLIQSKAIPFVLSGYNTLIMAPTGSGKTEATLFPIYSKVLENYGRAQGILVLYITPLRALNRDILVRMERIAKEIGLNVAVRHGDTTQYFRRKIAENPPHMLITTPETLHYLLVHNLMRKALKNVRWVVIDEVNELMSSKRGVILSVALERLVKLVGREFQRIGLSAVVGNVELAKRFLGGPRYVEVVEVEYEKPYKVIVETPQSTEEDEILASKEGLTPDTVARLRRIVEILDKAKSAIVFTNTRDLAELLASRLKSIFGINVLVHHGSLSRTVRVSVEKKLKEGIVKYVIATSSLELGIDVGRVNIVVQYGSPRQAIKLMQRIGRSGHREREESLGYIITLANIDDALESLVIARRMLHRDLEKEVIYDAPLDVLVYEVAGMLLEYGELNVYDIYKVFRRSFFYRNLSYETLIEVLSFASTLGIISFNGENVRRTRRTRMYYYEVSMIPDVKHYLVKNVIDNTIIGQLDEDFVITSLDIGVKFLLSGNVWEVLDYDEKYVYVKPAKEALGAIPRWEGGLIPVDYRVSREVGALKRRIINEGMKALTQYSYSQSTMNFILKKIMEHYSKEKWIPTDKNFVIEVIKGKTAIIHSHLGSKGNFGLMLIITYLLRKSGVEVVGKSDPYKIVLQSSMNIDAKYIIDELKSMDEGLLKYVLIENIKRSRIFKWKLYNVAKRFGAIRRDVSVKEVSKVLSHYVDTPIGDEAVKEVLTEKIDVNALINFIRLLKEEKIDVKVISSNDFSPLTSQSLSAFTYYDIAVESFPYTRIVEVFKRKIERKEVKLACLMCGNIIGKFRISNISEHPKCNVCGSGFLTVFSPTDKSIENILRKIRRNMRLSSSEKAILNEERLKADLVLRFGKAAIIALSTFGIGYHSAARIVGKYFEDRNEFYKELIEHQILFIRTRRYWRR